MNEKDVLKQSVKVFIGGLVIFSIVGFVLKHISFPLGFILGYAGSVLSFYIIIVMSDVILKMGQAIRFVVMYPTLHQPKSTKTYLHRTEQTGG